MDCDHEITGIEELLRKRFYDSKHLIRGPRVHNPESRELLSKNAPVKGYGAG
jgi:hypothetical protein